MKANKSLLLEEEHNQKLKYELGSKASRDEAPANELWGFLSKLEHRVEILMTIAHDQRASGYHELAEAYEKQAIESKKHAGAIRKLLIR